MKSRIASFYLAFFVIATPVFAQGPPAAIPGGGAIQQLASNLTALTARVAKLEGNIVASDLAGTYSMVVLNTTMRALQDGPPVEHGNINTSVGRSTFTLNADGTGSGSPFTCEGSTLTLGSEAMQGFDCSEPAGGAGDSGTWTYANGVLTVTNSEGEVIPFTVALGGRFLIFAFNAFHAGGPSSNEVLLIATRLN